jgi:hypothetical protein
MAVLFSSEPHVCRQCNRQLFEEIVLKTYNKVSDKVIKVSSVANVLKCVHCGHLTTVGQFKDVEIQE